MSTLLSGILGINWKTTLAGFGVLAAAATKVVSDFKSKDFVSVITDVNTIVTIIGGLAIGIGLIKAKDSNVTGVGDAAQAVKS